MNARLLTITMATLMMSAIACSKSNKSIGEAEASAPAATLDGAVEESAKGPDCSQLLGSYDLDEPVEGGDDLTRLTLGTNDEGKITFAINGLRTSYVIDGAKREYADDMKVGGSCTNTNMLVITTEDQDEAKFVVTNGPEIGRTGATVIRWVIIKPPVGKAGELSLVLQKMDGKKAETLATRTLIRKVTPEVETTESRFGPQ